ARAQGVGRWAGADAVAVRAGPDGDLVPPPEWARHTPVGCLLERLDRKAVLALGVEADPPRTQRLDGGAAELVHPAPPLWRHERLDPGVAALAGRHRVAGALPAVRPGGLPQPRQPPPGAPRPVAPPPTTFAGRATPAAH